MEMLFNQKEDQNHAVCRKMGGTGDKTQKKKDLIILSSAESVFIDMKVERGLEKNRKRITGRGKRAQEGNRGINIINVIM
jgi:hypothetical protein